LGFVVGFRCWLHEVLTTLARIDGSLASISALYSSTARSTSDVRTYLIGQISRAISDSDALGVGDADRLAEIAVDAMIESTRKSQIRPI